MAVCKECGALNPDSNKFCSECGQPIVKLDSKAIRDAMSQLEAEFEQDALIGLDRSRLTYICDVCGKVNPIDAKQCLRCGKKRPRSEYITALLKIKNSKNLKTAVNTMTKVEEKPIVTEAAISAPLKVREEVEVYPTPVVSKEVEAVERKEEAQQSMQLFRLDPTHDASVYQTRQVVQPFVIVPYVSQNQPLLQYDPNQVYRYDEYTDAEKKVQAERLALQKEEEARRKQFEENNARELRKRETEAMLSKKIAAKKRSALPKKASSGKVSVVSFLALLVAIGGIFAAFIDLIVKDFTMLQYVKGVSIIDLAKSLFEAPSFANQTEILFFVYTILVMVFLVVIALIAIQSFVRVFTGRVKKRGFLNLLLPIVALLLAVGIVVVNLANNDFVFEILFKDVFGWIVAAGVAVIIFVLYVIAGLRAKKRR